MNETKTLNEWLRELRYEWHAGEERMYKGEVTREEAVAIINDLHLEGAVRKRGR